MAGERPFASPGAGPAHASRRWRAMPRWAATAASVWVSHRLSPFSIYTLGLHRRGVPPPGRKQPASP